MDQVNGTTTPKKKQVLFSIGSYSERDRRVINKITTNGLFSSSTTDDASLRPHQPTGTLPKLRPVSLNFVDSTPKYKTLPARRRYTDELSIEKPACPPSSVCNSPAVENGPVADKPAFPPKIVDRSLSLEPEQLRHSGRVALTIAAYEGEPRTPTRLEFLPSGRVSRASSKASCSSTASTPSEDVDSTGSRMMLQNELVATLKRSNLKKLVEDDVFQENGTSNPPQEQSKTVEEPKTSKPIEKPDNLKPTEEVKKEEAPVELNKVSSIGVSGKKVAFEELKMIPLTEELEKNKVTEEPQKVLSVEVLKENSVTEDLEKIEVLEETSETKPEKEEIAAALSELENSTEEFEIIPPPPPMPLESDQPTEPKQSHTNLENGEQKEEELHHVETKDEADRISNGSVKQLAVELGKKMTFKADIERVPDQNVIKDD